MAISNATNAGLLAVRILGAFEPSLRDKLAGYHRAMAEESREKNTESEVRPDRPTAPYIPGKTGPHLTDRP